VVDVFAPGVVGALPASQRSRHAVNCVEGTAEHTRRQAGTSDGAARVVAVAPPADVRASPVAGVSIGSASEWALAFDRGSDSRSHTVRSTSGETAPRVRALVVSTPIAWPPFISSGGVVVFS
jgi:hypothetical protein